MNRQRDAHRPPEERNARHGEEGRQRVGECQKEFHDSFPFMPAYHHQLLGQKRDIQAGRDYNAQDEGNNPFFCIPFFLCGNVHAAYTGSGGENCQTLS